MQAIWRGAVSFGLITIPVRVFSATEEKSLRFNLLHAEDMGRVRNSRTCTVCGKQELGRDELVRGYEYEKGAYVTFADDELDAVPVSTLHQIEIFNFVPAEQIDATYYNRSYYLSPDDLGLKAYALLRRALSEAGRVAVAKVALRDKERLSVLRVRDDVLVMETMYWPDEVREPAFPVLDQQVEVKDRELQMALALIENLTEDFDPSLHADEYRTRLLEMVEAKVSGREIVAPAAQEPAPQVADLMDALQASLEAVKAKHKQAG